MKKRASETEGISSKRGRVFSLCFKLDSPDDVQLVLVKETLDHIFPKREGHSSVVGSPTRESLEQKSRGERNVST